MAQTDARAGFRLPWSQERSNIEQAETDQAGTADAGWPSSDTAPAADGQAAPAGENAGEGWGTSGSSSDWGTPSHESPVPQAPTPAPRKPSKFLADLTKAMQTAAEEARNNTLSQFQADAKAHVEQIHERSATEANTLRRQADDDVAAVREWSKQEIARVREETETKITARKGRLETEIEQHAAMIEREIEGVQGKVAGFEGEMAQFFERLLAEDDPTMFATMAENLPEPPAFDQMPELDPVEFAAQVEYEAAIAEPALTDDVVAEPEAEATAQTDNTWTGLETAATDEAVAEPETEQVTDADTQVGEAEAEQPTAETATPGEWGTPTVDVPAGEVPRTSRSTARPRSPPSRLPPRLPRAPRSRPMPRPAPRPSPTSRSRSSARTTKRTRGPRPWA